MFFHHLVLLPQAFFPDGIFTSGIFTIWHFYHRHFYHWYFYHLIFLLLAFLLSGIFTTGIFTFWHFWPMVFLPLAILPMVFLPMAFLPHTPEHDHLDPKRLLYVFQYSRDRLNVKKWHKTLGLKYLWQTGDHPKKNRKSLTSSRIKVATFHRRSQVTRGCSVLFFLWLKDGVARCETITPLLFSDRLFKFQI